MARGDYYQGIDPNRNPFSAATLSARPVQSGGGFGGMGVGQQAAASPAGFGGVPSSRASSGFNPLLAADSPFVTSTKLGALLGGFYGGPTRAQNYQQQLLQQGANVSTAAAQHVTQRAQVVGPQQAILEFAQSPLGNQFMQSNGDWEWLGRIASAAVSGQVAERRKAALTPPPKQPEPGIGQNDPWVGMRRAGEAPPSIQAGEFTPEQYVDAARELYAAQDNEGGDAALKLAAEARQIEEMGSTTDLKEYNAYVAQETAAGRPVMSFNEYRLTKPPSTKIDLNTAEGQEAAKIRARIDADIPVVKAASETALKAQTAIPLLDEAERVAETAPGGYAGVLTPYLAKIASSFGLQVPETWSDSETLYSISMQLVPLIRQPGQVSNYEQVAYMRALPALAQSVEGRKKIISMMRKQIARAQDVAKIMRNNIGEPDMYEKLAALDTKIFDAEETDFLQKINSYMDKGGKLSDPALRSLVDEFLGVPSGANQNFAPKGEEFTDHETGITYRSKGGARDEESTWEQIGRPAEPEPKPEEKRKPVIDIPPLTGVGGR